MLPDAPASDNGLVPRQTDRIRTVEPRETTVLIVDDSQDSRALIEAMVGGAGYRVLLAGSAEEAFALLGLGRRPAPVRPVDVILMDLSLPRLDGLAATRRIHLAEALRDVPIIVVTARGQADVLDAAFAAGARDFVCKPVRHLELIARLRAAVELSAEVGARRAFAEALREANQRLEEANEALRRLTCLDWLTGLPNRLYFEAAVDIEWRRARRAGEAISLLVVDLDRFRDFNERHGHAGGDECLRRVAGLLRAGLVRPGDFLGRHDGARFAAVLPHTPEWGALIVAERLRRQVELLEPGDGEAAAGRRVTVSIGVAAAAPDQESATLDDLTAAAERALAAAKAAGRNLVSAAPVRAAGPGPRSGQVRA